MFKARKINYNVAKHSNQNNFWSNIFTKKKIWIFSAVLIWLIGLYFYASFLQDLFYSWVKMVSKGTVKVISVSLGKEMKKSPEWIVYVMIVWFWWVWHEGWYLADTNIVAWFDPKNWAVSMLSLPRDLFVKIDTWRYGRINASFAHEFADTKDLQKAADAYSKKVSNIVWVDINYFALVDFKWFKWLIDSFSGVDVYVDKPIYDPLYPTPSWWYATFKMWSWWQHMDWETALKYARSRHSTSDFSRSARQQQIIKAIIEKVLDTKNLTNVSKLKEMYGLYTTMVTTNISVWEMLRLAQYWYDLKKLSSFNLTTNCGDQRPSKMVAWCFLYTPERDFFDWASVVIPDWATVSKVTFYDYIHNFVKFALWDQWYLIENPTIRVVNWVDKKNKRYKNIDNLIWVKLKKYWFNVLDGFTDSEQTYPKSSLIVNSWVNYTDTLKQLSKFINLTPNVVNNIQILSWSIMTGDEYNEPIEDLTLIIGDDYVTVNSWTKFNIFK